MADRTLPAGGLAWLGRHGTGALALMAMVGIALPVLGALLKPLIAASVFLLLVLAFIRVDLAALRGHVRRPAVAHAWHAGRRSLRRRERLPVTTVKNEPT